MIKQAATDLGVGDMHSLLAAMVSRKNFADIMSNQEKDYNKRLELSNTQEERDRLQAYAKQYSREITLVLHQINKDVMLLFKTNDFLSSITSRLGDPVKKYEIMAKYCLEEVEQQELKRKNDAASRVKLWWQKTSTLVGFQLYGLYYSCISMFKRSELPDQVLL